MTEETKSSTKNIYLQLTSKASELLSKLKEKNSTELFELAVQDDEAAELIAMDPESREKIIYLDWEILIRSKPQLAAIILSIRSSTIFDNISVDGIVDLVKGNASLIPAIIIKFPDDKKLKKEHWIDIAKSCGEDALQLLKNEKICKNFKSADFLSIARRNSKIIPTIIDLYRNRLDSNHFESIMQLIPSSERLKKFNQLATVEALKNSPTLQRDKVILEELSGSRDKKPSPDNSSNTSRTSSRISFHQQTSKNLPESDEESELDESNESGSSVTGSSSISS